MPYQTIRIQPGIDTEKTPLLNQTGWASCSLIRWMAGLPQKLGGWQKYISGGYSSPTRALLAWVGQYASVESPALSNNQKWLAVATEASLNAVYNGVNLSITPQKRTQDVAVSFTTISGSAIVSVAAVASNLSQYSSVYISTPVAVGGLILYGAYAITSLTSTDAWTITASSSATSGVVGGAVPSFTTVSGSPTVTVTLVAHGYTALASQVDFQVSTTVGGVTISGVYTVQTTPTADTFTIRVPSNATSGTTGSMNGGNVHFVYYTVSGPAGGGVGWGGGAWGSGAWGLGTTPSYTAGTAITSSNWSLDNFGNILIACQEQGPIFYWSPNQGFMNARLIEAAPYINNGIFVAMPQQILVAYGSTTIGNIFNPMLVKWSDVSDFTSWSARSTTQAGSFPIPKGNALIGGMSVHQQQLIWSDVGVWSMSYLGPPLVFGFNEIASGCGLIGKHAVTKMFGIVYWMSNGNFFALDSQGVHPIPCTVWDIVFQNLDTTNQTKCIAAANSLFNEIAFYFPSTTGGTGDNDSYVKFNAANGLWDYGPLGRTAWIDQSVLGNPVGGDHSGFIYQHEMTNDADGAALSSSITTGWFMLTEGDPVAFVDLLLPDFYFGTHGGSAGAQIQITIQTADYPGATVYTSGPYTVTTATKWINVRARGRLMRATITSSDIGSFWRLGDLRYRASIDGRRGTQ